MPLCLGQMESFLASRPGLLHGSLKQGSLCQREQDIEQQSGITCLAQQVTSLLTQCDRLQSIALSQPDKGQGGEGCGDSCLMTRLTIEGETGLAQLYGQLIVSSQTENQPKIDL